ncbi:MAG: L,D-transpeptidase family protein [Bdellovibrionales bacterium]|jgi:L,D-transpeptidase ErfK/SrfK|nr:L,D-transpeptidase family protein [Bdellovibrionales bacterium]
MPSLRLYVTAALFAVFAAGFTAHDVWAASTSPKANAEKNAPPKANAEKKPAQKPKAAKALGDGSLKVTNKPEDGSLPDYPMGARISMGKQTTYKGGEEDTFLDIARHFTLGYVELRAANPEIDPWAPPPGQDIVIPGFQLLPRARQQGVVVNLAKMRLYYFRDPGSEPITYPIGIGSEGLDTPTGVTKVVRKAAGPSWYPTERMRSEKPWLPRHVPPGISNPLGTHALYLGWPTYLIHGSNKPWGIGRRVSSGCMRMYPENVVEFFGMVPVGTRVTIVDQPILVGWLDDGLYLEANPTYTQSVDLENGIDITPTPLTDKMREMIVEAAGVAAGRVNWSMVEKTIRERRGIPVMIATPSAKDSLPKDAAKNTGAPAASGRPPRPQYN